MKWLILIGCIIFPSYALATVLAEEIKFESGVRQTAMIELFTSQGCSSCPPAEEYLNTFTSHPELWTRFIPVAMHVDYWDYLGWKDAFAKARHSRRQRTYARVTRARTVFTPAFFVNGSNWRPGFTRRSPNPDAPDVGNLTVSVKGNTVAATLSGRFANADNLVMNIGLVGMGLKTKIQAGENAGRYSKHEFVLLDQMQLTRKKSDQWIGNLPKLDVISADRYALIAWASKSGSPAPIQATGRFLPKTFLAREKTN